MNVDEKRAELMKLYPNSDSWKVKCATWPDDRIRAVFDSCVKYDRWNKQKKAQQELAKHKKASSSYYHQMDMYELNMLVIGGNND